MVSPVASVSPAPTASSRWQRILPPADLAAFVDNFQFAHVGAGAQLPRVLPGTGALCCFLLGGSLQVDDVHAAARVPVSSAFILCNRHHVLDLSAGGATRCLVISFRPGRLRYFVSASFSELQDHITPLDELWGQAGATLPERLSDSADFAAQAEVLSEFLRSRMHQERQAKLDSVMDLLYLSPETRISDLAHEAGWTLRHFERLFSTAYGVTPKFFARVARLQRVARALALQPGAKTSLCALDAGFFDQSHFIHELQKLARLSPLQLASGVRDRPHFYNPKAIQRYAAMLADTLGNDRVRRALAPTRHNVAEAENPD